MLSPDCPCGIRRSECDYHKPTAAVFGPTTEKESKSYKDLLPCIVTITGEWIAWPEGGGLWFVPVNRDD